MQKVLASTKERSEIEAEVKNKLLNVHSGYIPRTSRPASEDSAHVGPIGLALEPLAPATKTPHHIFANALPARVFW